MTAPGFSTRPGHPARDVFIVCNTIHELGGVQRFAHRLGGLLAERGHRVRLVGIFAVADPHQPADAAAAPYQTMVVHPDRFSGRVRPSAALSRVSNPVAVARYRRWEAVQRAGAQRLAGYFAQAQDPDTSVVICAQVHAMEWVERAARPGLPVIAMSHESYAASMASSRGRRVKQLYARAARFLSLTEADATRWTLEGGMNNAAAIPNPLPLPPTGGADPGARVVVAAGRLSQEKGFDLLLESWAQASASRPGWTLRIYGSGPEETRLREQARALGLGPAVDFAGQTSDIAAALVGGSIFASASRAEGFPMSLLEAMACGLPCVAFDCAPGIREIITDGYNGLVVPPGNTIELAEALGRLMDSREDRAAFGKAAVGSLDAFAPDRVIDRWEALFDLVRR